MTVQWTTLIHNGVIFHPYKPHGVKMLYKGNPVDLTPEQERVASLFAGRMDTHYVREEKFIENFMNDWRKLLGENHVIENFADCNFTPIYEWIQRTSEKAKQMREEDLLMQENQALIKERVKREEKYAWATVDGVKRKVMKFRILGPQLFCSFGHPETGKVMCILPRDITINIGEGAPIPDCPIPGESWKKVIHNNRVNWLAYWNDPNPMCRGKRCYLLLERSDEGQEETCRIKEAKGKRGYLESKAEGQEEICETKLAKGLQTLRIC